MASNAQNEEFEFPEDVVRSILDYYPNVINRRLISRYESRASLLEFLKNNKLPSKEEIENYLNTCPPNTLLISNDEDKGINMYTSFIRSDMVWYCQDGTTLENNKNYYDSALPDAGNIHEILSDGLVDIDIRMWYNILNKRFKELNISKNIIREAVHYIFDRTRDNLLRVSNIALFMYFYYSYRVLGISFEKYFDIIDGSSSMDLNIDYYLLEEMTNRFRLGIDRMIDTSEI